MRELAALLEARARERGAEEALVDPTSGLRLTWTGLLEQVASREGALRRAGVGAGERVGILLDRSPGWLAWLHAMWRLGGVPVPLGLASPPAELQGLMAHAEVSWLCFDPGASPEAPEAAPPGCGLLDGREGDLLRPRVFETPPSPEGDALILYTSGSTGEPKGGRHTQASVAASLRGLTRRYFSRGAPRVLSALPLGHSHGLFTHGLSGLAHGGALILAPVLDLFSAGRLWSCAREEGAAFFSAVPDLFRLLLRAAEDRPPSGMRVCSASSPLSEDLREEFRGRFGLAPVNNFGMTETAGWSLYSALEAPVGCLGRPGECRLRVEDGELLLAGEQVSPGYWRAPARTAEAFRDGWLRTGDLVEADEEGWVHYRGRRKRVIQVAGLSVHPEDIEAALRGLDAVRDCAVVGAEDPVYGEQPRAFVVLRPGATAGPADLARELRRLLAPYRCPRYIEVLGRLPVTAGGKTDFPALARRPLPIG